MQLYFPISKGWKFYGRFWNFGFLRKVIGFSWLGLIFHGVLIFRCSQRGDLYLITLKRFRKMLLQIWEGFWLIGWWRLLRSTNLSQTLCISPLTTLIDICLWTLSTGRSFSYWVFLQCSLLRKRPSLFFPVHFFETFLSVSCLLFTIFIRRKYEEITPPNVEDFCYITDNTYTKEEVVKMEADILKSLSFELGSPTVKTFLRSETVQHKKLFSVEISCWYKIKTYTSVYWPSFPSFRFAGDWTWLHKRITK